MDRLPAQLTAEAMRRPSILVATPSTASRVSFWSEIGRIAPDLAIEALEDPTSLRRSPDLVVWPVEKDVARGQDLDRATRRFPRAALVATAERDDARCAWLAFRAGFRGYLPAKATPHVAAAGLRLVLVGGLFVPAFMLDDRDALDPEPSRGGEAHRLTERETDVLQRLRRGLQNKLIAYELGISQSTVKVHVRSIMRKTAATNRTQVVCRIGPAQGRLPIQAPGGARGSADRPATL